MKDKLDTLQLEKTQKLTNYLYQKHLKKKKQPNTLHYEKTTEMFLGSN